MTVPSSFVVATAFVKTVTAFVLFGMLTDAGVLAVGAVGKDGGGGGVVRPDDCGRNCGVGGAAGIVREGTVVVLVGSASDPPAGALVRVCAAFAMTPVMSKRDKSN